MTVGQDFERQGPLRIKFYDSVLREANEASSLYMPPLVYLLPQQLYDKFNVSEVSPMSSDAHGVPMGKI